MSVATKCLKKQKQVYFSYIWRGIALMGIGVFAGTMILKDGIGKAPVDERSKGAFLYKLLTSLMGQSVTAEMVVPICFAGFFFIIAAIGLFNLIRGTWQILPAHTMLGKSIMHQKKEYESLRDVIASIDMDMKQEPHVFDTIFIGREWILGQEAMRLSQIQGVFWIDYGKTDFVLCCVDEDKNIWAGSVEEKVDRDNALKYMEKRWPDLIVGNKEAYIAFLKEEELQTTDSEDLQKAKEAIVLQKNTKFSFLRVDGIPTSNYTYEEVSEALHSLEQGQGIAVMLFAPVAYIEDIVLLGVTFSHLYGGQWETGLKYQKDDKDSQAAKYVDRGEAESILAKVLKENQLPNLF